MRFYTQTHQYYCGIDLHARSMYLCILNQAGEVLVHRNIPTDGQRFLKVIAPFQEDVVVANLRVQTSGSEPFSVFSGCGIRIAR